MLTLWLFLKAMLGGLTGKGLCAYFFLCEGSGGGSTSSNSSTSVSWPPWAKNFLKQFVPQGEAELAASNPINNPNTLQVMGQLQKEVGGYYTDPANNPTLAPSVKAITDTAQDYLGRNIAGINRGANAGGMLLSTKTAQAGDQAVRDSTRDVTNQVAQLYGGEYDKARAAQIGAYQPLFENADPNYQMALELMKTFGGMGKSHSSGFGTSASMGGGAT